MATEVESPKTTVQPITKPSSMTLDPNSRPSGISPETNLPVIDETKPCLDVDVDVDSEENGEWRVGSPPESPCRKKCMKDRLKGLADKYVSCLQAVDGAGDMRGFAGGGGPTMLHGPQPFESATTSPASD